MVSACAYVGRAVAAAWAGADCGNDKAKLVIKVLNLLIDRQNIRSGIRLESKHLDCLPYMERPAVRLLGVIGDRTTPLATYPVICQTWSIS
jgi:hypothetical protein